MNAVLIAWLASVAFCSLYTLILPTWDAYVERRDARTLASQSKTTNPTRSFPVRTKTQSTA